jgi:2-oxoglutarate ferredoxin oxidoreductase subunit gamma
MERCRLVLAGSGGQGVITAAIILAEAAVLHENLEATQTQSYGPEARGGATRADVIVSDSPIRFPKVIRANVLVCLTQQAYRKFASILRPGGLLLTDTRYVEVESAVDARQVQLPLYHEVMEQTGTPVALNVCTLGAVLGLTDVVKPDSVKKVLKNRVPGSFLDVNLKALELGLSLGRAHVR